jgi:CubicO group peptidase (beta-lactamase class C family)
VVLDGSLMQSVTGGGHWGGGSYINAYDMARLGCLTLRRGKWKGSSTALGATDRSGTHADWTGADLRLHELVPQYRPQALASARATAFAHSGNGTNPVYVDPEHDLVAVVRWIDGEAIDGFLKRLLAAIDHR